MNLVETSLVTAVRSLVVTVGAMLPALLLAAWLRQLSRSQARSALAIGAIVYFTPTMLAGYGWLPTIGRCPANSAARELFYVMTVVIRLAPIAALGIWLGGDSRGEVARHVWRLAGGSGWRWRWREAGAGPWLVAGAVFLLAFQEFDLATSWGIRSWTVVLFDAQIGGLALGDSLFLSVAPFALEVAILAPLLLALATIRRVKNAQHSPTTARGAAAALIYLLPGAAVFVVLPALFVFRLGREGFGAWLESLTLGREVMHGVVAAALAAVAAWSIASAVRGRWVGVLAAPGLMGPLLLGLCLLAGLQMLPALGETVLPWLLGLTLQLLPVALLLRAVVERGTDATALHTAEMTKARSVLWLTKWRPAFGALVVLFGIAYSDFTIGALLAPPQFTTVFVRVFNLMHYGQSEVLSATVFVAVVVPFLAFALLFGAGQLIFMRRDR